MHTPPLVHESCRSRVACVLLRSQELRRQESNAPGRSSQAEQVLGGGARRSMHPDPPGLGIWLRVNSPELLKNNLVAETATKTSTTTVCDGLPESSETCMNGSSESRKEDGSLGRQNKDQDWILECSYHVRDW